jgi:hypothetical protein
MLFIMSRMINYLKTHDLGEEKHMTNIKKNRNFNFIKKAIQKDSDQIFEEVKSHSNNSQELTPERIAEIIHRINQNFYDQEDVLKVVAERILHSPELQKLIKNR